MILFENWHIFVIFKIQITFRLVTEDLHHLEVTRAQNPILLVLGAVQLAQIVNLKQHCVQKDILR